MNDPVDDFARGPEVKFGHEDERMEIRKEGAAIPMDEILSVLKPYAKRVDMDRRDGFPVSEIDARARDLFLKLGGVL